MTNKPDQPPSGMDHRKPCLCNGICLGKEQLRSNRVCQFDLACPAQPADGIDWKQRAETAEAELVVAKLKTNRLLCEAVDQFMNDALVAIAGAVCTPEKGYIEDGGLQLLLSDIERLRKQHDAANSRLAKVRDALTRLAKWAEFSPFAEGILAEAQAALAEGEG